MIFISKPYGDFAQPPILLEHWKFDAAVGDITTVLPDGCRDLIIWRGKGVRPQCFVTDLATGCDQVPVSAGDHFNGFRLHPGVRIDVDGLLASLDERLDDVSISARLHDFATPLPQVSEALACLASGVTSVSDAATILGVRLRSLQRLLKRETGQAPVFWLRLARARQAVSRLGHTAVLADLACDAGYADQAHMTREFRRWFGTTPHRIRADTGWLAQNFVAGYGA